MGEPEVQSVHRRITDIVLELHRAIVVENSIDGDADLSSRVEFDNVEPVLIDVVEAFEGQTEDGGTCTFVEITYLHVLQFWHASDDLQWLSP